MNADDVVVVMITVPSGEVGERIATVLVEERLAACVNIIPGIRSIFSWEGRTQEERELLLLVKTQAGKVSDLETRVRDTHPYSVPEILALPAVAGYEPYLAWVADCVSTKGGDDSDQE